MPCYYSDLKTFEESSKSRNLLLLLACAHYPYFFLLLLLLLFLAIPWSLQYLSPPTRDQMPALEAWSLNHWTTRKSPSHSMLEAEKYCLASPSIFLHYNTRTIQCKDELWNQWDLGLSPLSVTWAFKASQHPWVSDSLCGLKEIIIIRVSCSMGLGHIVDAQ